MAVRFILMLPLLMVAFLALANPEMAVTAPGNISAGRIPQEEWNRTFGGPSDDVGTWVLQTKDGGYIITGYTSSYGSDAPYSWIIKAPYRGDLWLVKTDSAGTLEWDRTFGGLGREMGFFVQQTRDDGYIITGGKKSFWISDYHLWVIKTDPSGVQEWDKTFEGSGEDLGFSVRQTKDDGYIVAGYTSAPDGRKAWLIKIDSEGNKEWDRTIGQKDSEASSIQQTNDSGYIITGYTSSRGAGKEDVWLVKTDSIGTIEWLHTFGGPKKDIGFSVQETNDCGYIITGFTESFGAGARNVWLIKTDSNGIKEWDRTFGGPDYDSGACVQQTADGGYIITGYNTTSAYASKLGRVWLIKTDSNGNREWDRTFGGARNDWGNSVEETQDGGYIITGVTESFGAGNEDIWLIKVK
jgi:hypothetical protein